MKPGMRLWFLIALLFPAFVFAQATSEADELRRRALMRFPQADTNGDGILTEAEALAFRQQRLANRKPPEVIAPPPTHEDVRYGPYDRNLYDLWLPESAEPTPLVIYVHGGGFRNGDKSLIRSQEIVEDALDGGLAVAAVNYRFVYRAPEDLNDPQKTSIQNILRDSARALQHLRHHASEYNIDPTRVGMWGGSAGAGTSLFIAFRDDLADPSSEDPVLRQSTRLSAVGMINGQFSYDVESWDPQFAERYGPDTKTRLEISGRPGFTGFYGLSAEDYSGPPGRAARADVDMINYLSPDDPPVFVYCSNPALPPLTLGEIQHDPLHAELIEARAREKGLEVVAVLPMVRSEDADASPGGRREVLQFFLQHLTGDSLPSQ